MTSADRAALLSDVAAACLESMQYDAEHVTVLRLADNSIVPIELEPNKADNLRIVIKDGFHVKHCRRGHVLIKETMLTNGVNYRCLVCTRARNRKKQQAHNKRYYKAHAFKERERKRYERRNQKKSSPVPRVADAL